MRTKGKKHLALILALGAAFTPSPSASAQAKRQAGRRPATPVASGVEPLRVLGGQMRGRTVTGRFKAKGRESSFSFEVTKAEIVDGKLQLSGDFRLGRSARATGVKAKMAGTLAKAANPWPGSIDEEPAKEEAPANEQKQGREAKSAEAAAQLGQLAQSTQDTARKTPPAPGERNEQTQSLYAQAEKEIGCGVFYLSMEVPGHLRAAMGAGAPPVQLGVMLAPLDNRAGEEINRRICAIVRMTSGKSGDNRLSASVDDLNRLLAVDNHKR